MTVRVVSPARNEEHAWRREEEMVFEPNRREVPEASPEVSAAAVAAVEALPQNLALLELSALIGVMLQLGTTLRLWTYAI